MIASTLVVARPAAIASHLVLAAYRPGLGHHRRTHRRRVPVSADPARRAVVCSGAHICRSAR
jgi:hypothetical protein